MEKLKFFNISRERCGSYINQMNYLKICIVVLLVIIIGEHISRLQNLPIRLSTLLVFASTFLRKVFESAGRLFAWISSYLTEIDIMELAHTLCDLIKPTIKIICLPYYFLLGYMEQVETYVDKVWMVYIGSVLLIATVSYFCYKYRNRILLAYLLFCYMWYKIGQHLYLLIAPYFYRQVVQKN